MSAMVGSSTVNDLIGAACAVHGGRTALVDGTTGASVTYAEFEARVASIATWLQEAGVEPGGRVGIVAPNVPPVAACTVAIMRLGAAVTAVNTASTATETARQLDDAAADVVITVPELVPSLRSSGRHRLLSLGAADGATSLRDALSTPAAVAEVANDPGAVAALPYSSGTTGRPKGVMLSHANLAAVCRQLTDAIEITERDVTIAVAPFSHILGLTGAMLLPLSAGAAVVTLPRFDPVEFVTLLDRHRATYIAIPPPVAALLARHPIVDERDLSSLQWIAVGGAPLASAIHDALARRLPHCVIGQGWGLTETAGAVSVPRRADGAPAGTVGRPLIDTEVRVVDPDGGTSVADGHDGELWVRGPQVMVGYLNRPEDTRAIITDDGWLRTGDLGHVDRSGNVVIVDRLKELIKVNAFQVAPAEVEDVLLAHPDIQDAAVTARPDDRTGEAPVAFVVASPGLGRQSLDDWITERLAPYKRPVDIRLVDALPRSPSGKLLRRQLRDVVR